MIDRLALDEKRIASMAEGLREVAALPDPVGEVTGMWRRPNGIQVGRMRIPLGVIGIVYESRPNVTADAAGLCLKSGNAVILRGGSEAIHSNTAIGKLLRRELAKLGLPPAALQVVATTDRSAVLELLQREEEIDLIIPRGGEGPDPLRQRATPGFPSSSTTRASATPSSTPAPTSRWPKRSASTPRCSAPGSATPWRRC